MNEPKDRDALKAKLLQVLTRHPSPARAIGMGELYAAVFGESHKGTRINGTRALRRIITELREDGTAIASHNDGYYLATTRSDVAEYCKRVRAQALRKLVQEARIRNVALPALLSEMQLNLQTGRTA